MSMKRMLLAASAAIALIGPATDASAQNYDRQRFDRQKYDRQAVALGSPPTPKMHVDSARKAVAPAKRPVEPVEEVVKPVPVEPLTEEQIAAKAAVDELLAREPALMAAKNRPDPALAKAAAARHNAQEQKLAALKAKEDAAAAKRKEIADRIKSQEDARAAALKAKPDAQAKSAKPKPTSASRRRAELRRASPSRTATRPRLRLSRRCRSRRYSACRPPRPCDQLTKRCRRTSVARRFAPAVAFSADAECDSRDLAKQEPIAGRDP